MAQEQEVKVAITAVDLTSPAFASAQAATQSLQRTVEANSGSFREARAAAKLFSEEIGVGMNRELLRAVASSQLLQGALSAVLPVGLAIGFAEMAMRIPEAIKKATDALAGYGESSKKVMEDAIAANDKIFTQFKTLEDGYKRLDEVRKLAASAGAAKDNFSDPFYGVGQAFSVGGLTGGVSQLYSNYSLAKQFREESAHWDDDETKAIARQGELQVERNKNEEQFAESAARARAAWVASIDAAEKASKAFFDKDNAAQKQIDAINEQIAKWREVANERAGINAIANQYTAQLQQQKSLIEAQVAADKANPLRNLEPAKMPDLGAPAMPLYSGSNAAMNLYNIQNNQAAAIKEAQKIYDDTATAAQKYSDTIAGLTEILNQGRISQDQFAAAAIKAGADLDKSPYKKYYEELGRDIGRTIEQAALFEGSWSRTFKALLADIIKLILQMYVFKSLADQYGGANGGFLGAFFSGLAGQRASGGPVNASMSYIVGESGPELFTPGVSGAITPNGALGGQIVQHFDMRGSVIDGDVVKKAELAGAMHATENRAVARAVAATADQRARR